MKAVLFDLFGTLVDNPTNEQVFSLHASIAEVLGVPPEEYAKGWKLTFHDRASGLHGSIAKSIAAAAKQCSAIYKEEALEQAVIIRHEFTKTWLTPRSDAVSTIAELKGRGLKIGLLSNCTAEVPEIWPKIAFAPIIDQPLFSCNEGLRKPMPEFYERALTRLGVQPAECLYVADGDNGELKQSKALGISTVMIRNSGQLNDYRTDPEDDWTGPKIECLSDLLTLIP